MTQVCEHGQLARVCALCEAHALNAELIRRLHYMIAFNSDSAQWYRNAILQALKSADALPAPLDFEV